MIHLMTTLIVLTQNFIPLKRFSSMRNIISLIPSVQSRKLIRFCTKQTNFTKRSIISAKRKFVFKIYLFLKVLLIYTQRCTLKYINLHFNQITFQD